MRYFGFAIGDSMFPPSCVIRKAAITDTTPYFAAEVVSCCNPSHAPTLAVARDRFGIALPVPEKAPLVKLAPGDEILVMAVRGLPRLEGRHEYTAEEIGAATFEFSHYEVSRS